VNLTPLNSYLPKFLKIHWKYKATAALVLLSAYIGAFIIVHRSATLRKPAANMAYWYYSDNPVNEDIEFYGFWPLRNLGYRYFPDFEGRHNSERIYPDIRNEGI
jgi:hypothetical protein